MFNLFNKKIDNDYYGGFLISKNITHNNQKARYCYREKKNIKELNGWTVLSEIDSDDYVKNPDNFEIVSATTMFSKCPFMREIFEAPYGTDLFVHYNNDGTINQFYDLKSEKYISVKEILKK